MVSEVNDIKIQQQDFLNSLQYKKNPGKMPKLVAFHLAYAWSPLLQY